MTDSAPEYPLVSSDAVRKAMKSQRRVDTEPELRIRRELHARGYRYFVDRSVLEDLRRRRADIVFPTERVSVFVDGCFWHRCPEHFTMPKSNRDWWAAKLQRNVERDRDTDERLEEAGWTVIRIWEHEGTQVAVDRVIGVVEGRRT